MASRMAPVDWLNAMMAGEGMMPRWRRYFEPVAALSKGLPAPILGIMVLIWQLRERDLQQRYPLHTTASRLDFLSWCVLHGRREYAALRQAGALWQALDQPASFGRASALQADDPAHAISWKMVLAIRERSDLAFDPGVRSGRAQLLLWWVASGRIEEGYGDDCFTGWQNAWFFAASAIPGLNRLQALIYSERPDVAAVYPLPQAQANYIGWFRHYISEETRIIDALRCLPQRLDPSRQPMPAPATSTVKARGVNVVGYAFGQLGIGEDARMAVRSLQAARVPVTLLNFSPGRDIAQQDQSMAAWVGTEPVYGVNMFCLAAQEHGRLFAEWGADLLVGRLNIGYWPWELAEWPRPWQHLLALVDEIWVSSEHTLQALAPVSQQLALRHMPMAVTVDEVAPRTRADFGLPPDACLFLFAFDLNSSAKRKNPQACVQAFLRAFPPGGAAAGSASPVGLVIKIHPPRQQNDEWDALKRLQQADPRIHLIEQTLGKADLLALYRLCDCFLSLHRAEGFGRCIAEAMLLGKPVISTGYSGNLAFTNAENALLVNYRLRALARDDYPFGAGQKWAEPSVVHAASLLQTVARMDDKVRQLAHNGQRRIATMHNPATIGQRYAAVLAQHMPFAPRAAQLLIVDQNASGQVGHYLAYTECVAQAAIRDGLRVQILCHQNLSSAVFAPALAEAGVALQRCFGRRSGECDGHGMPPAGAGHLLDEIARVVLQTGAGTGDHVLIHTLGLVELRAVLEYLLQQSTATLQVMPMLHLVLRFDPRELEMDSSSVWARLRWQLQQRRTALASCLHCCADTGALAQRYAQQIGLPVTRLPIPFESGPLLAALQGQASKPRPGSHSVTAMYLGDARPEKGFDLLPALVNALWESHLQCGKLRLVIQANPNVAGGQGNTMAAIAALSGWPPSCVELIHAPMSRTDYLARLASADMVLLPYDAMAYHSRSSGVLIEALAAGKPVVTTRGSWLASVPDERQMALFDGDHSLAEALADLLARLPDAKQVAQANAARWQAFAAPAHFLQQLLLPVDGSGSGPDAQFMPQPIFDDSATTDSARIDGGIDDSAVTATAGLSTGIAKFRELAFMQSLLAAWLIPDMEMGVTNDKLLAAPAWQTVGPTRWRQLLSQNWARLLGPDPHPHPEPHPDPANSVMDSHWSPAVLPQSVRHALLEHPARAIGALMLLSGLQPVVPARSACHAQTSLVIHGGLQNTLVVQLRSIGAGRAMVPEIQVRLNGQILSASPQLPARPGQDRLVLEYALTTDEPEQAWHQLQVVPLEICLAPKTGWELDTALLKEHVSMQAMRQNWRVRPDWHAPETAADGQSFAWSATATSQLFTPFWRGCDKLLILNWHAMGENHAEDIQIVCGSDEALPASRAGAGELVFSLPVCKAWPLAHSMQLKVRSFARASPTDWRRIGIAIHGYTVVQKLF